MGNKIFRGVRNCGLIFIPTPPLPTPAVPNPSLVSPGDATFPDSWGCAAPGALWVSFSTTLPGSDKQPSGNSGNCVRQTALGERLSALVLCAPGPSEEDGHRGSKPTEQLAIPRGRARWRPGRAGCCSGGVGLFVGIARVLTGWLRKI